MAAYSPKFGMPNEEAKIHFVIEMLRHKNPDLRISLEPFTQGDYQEFLFDGIGRYRLSNTEVVMLSPNEIATRLENFIREKMPVELEPGFRKTVKREKLTPADEWAEDWAKKNAKN